MTGAGLNEGSDETVSCCSFWRELLEDDDTEEDLLLLTLLDREDDVREEDDVDDKDDEVAEELTLLEELVAGLPDSDELPPPGRTPVPAPPPPDVPPVLLDELLEELVLLPIGGTIWKFVLAAGTRYHVTSPSVRENEFDVAAVSVAAFSKSVFKMNELLCAACAVPASASDRRPMLMRKRRMAMR